jgi:hypothetical protein
LPRALVAGVLAVTAIHLGLNTPLYPLAPIAFIAASIVLLVGSFIKLPNVSVVNSAITLLGLKNARRPWCPMRRRPRNLPRQRDSLIIRAIAPLASVDIDQLNSK